MDKGQEQRTALAGRARYAIIQVRNKRPQGKSTSVYKEKRRTFCETEGKRGARRAQSVENMAVGRSVTALNAEMRTDEQEGTICERPTLP